VDSEEILTATIDPADARQKRLVIVPGRFEMNTVDDRRPELYGRLLRKVEKKVVAEV